MNISQSLKVKIITAYGEIVTIAQDMVALIWRPIDGNAIGAAKIKNGELPIRLELDLSVISRDTLILNNNIVIQLAANFDDRFLNVIYLLAGLRQLDAQGGLRHIDGTRCSL